MSTASAALVALFDCTHTATITSGDGGVVVCADCGSRRERGEWCVPRLLDRARHLLRAEVPGVFASLCAESTCPRASTMSVVWPGRGRIAYCPDHFAKMLAVASAMGLSAESLDVRPS